MNSADPTVPRSREGDVHPLRLRIFLEKLARRLPREELEDHLAGLPPTRQEICRTIQGVRWLPAEEERPILEALGAIDRAYLLLEETGHDTFFSQEDVRRLRPSSDSVKGVLFRLPAFVALCCTHLGVSLRVEDREMDIRVHFNAPYRESHTDLFFLWGFLKGLLYAYRVSDFDLSLASTALRRDSLLRSSRSTSESPEPETPENVFRLKLFHGTFDDVVHLHPSLGEDEPADEDWARQVKARSAELLQDNRELLTAVEYLNMANDELESKIQSNQRELDIARHIQRGFVPDSVPAWRGLQFRSSFMPLREVSGDFYDSFTLGSNKIGFLVCDVSGHGVPAALISAIARLSFHNHRLDSPSEVFGAVNRDVLDYVRGEGFVAAFYMIIDSDYRLVYSRAGVPAPVLLREKTGEVEELAGEGIILGMFPDAERRFHDGYTMLEPGDKLFLFTDGLTEATGPGGTMLGEAGVREVVRETVGMDAEAACDHLSEAYRRHILGTDPRDDVTIVVVSLSDRLEEFDRLLGRARRRYNAADMAGACADLEQAIEIFPRHPPTLFLLGRYLTRARRFADAMEYLYRYNTMKPYNADAYRILGECAYHLKHYLQASEFLKKALSLRSEFPAALYLMALVQLQLLNYEKALEYQAELEELRPEHERVRRLRERLADEIPPGILDR